MDWRPVLETGKFRAHLGLKIVQSHRCILKTIPESCAVTHMHGPFGGLVSACWGREVENLKGVGCEGNGDCWEFISVKGWLSASMTHVKALSSSIPVGQVIPWLNIRLAEKKGQVKNKSWPLHPKPFHKHSRVWCPHRVCQMDYFSAVFTCPEVTASADETISATGEKWSEPVQTGAHGNAFILSLADSYPCLMDTLLSPS